MQDFTRLPPAWPRAFGDLALIGALLLAGYAPALAATGSLADVVRESAALWARP